MTAHGAGEEQRRGRGHADLPRMAWTRLAGRRLPLTFAITRHPHPFSHHRTGGANDAEDAPPGTEAGPLSRSGGRVLSRRAGLSGLVLQWNARTPRRATEAPHFW